MDNNICLKISNTLVVVSQLESLFEDAKEKEMIVSNLNKIKNNWPKDACLKLTNEWIRTLWNDKSEDGLMVIIEPASLKEDIYNLLYGKRNVYIPIGELSRDEIKKLPQLISLSSDDLMLK